MTVTTLSSDGLPCSAGGGWPRLRVAVASDQSLVAEAVGAALASRHITVALLAWPAVPKDAPVHRQIALIEPDVALLIYDVDLSVRMARATALIGEWDGPWVVLTSVVPGAAWGGLREAGAVAIRPSETGLDDLEGLFGVLADGGVAPGSDELERHLDSWRSVQERLGGLQERLNGLTPRELQILDLLRAGVAVRPIAVRLGLSESTVRSQVRAVLNKLQVRSQLAAVALVRGSDLLQSEPAPEHDDPIRSAEVVAPVLPLSSENGG